jgi:predicted DNA-binding transcriptional regulator AlpA
VAGDVTLVEHLLTPREVASRVGVSGGALAQRRHRGDGPPFVRWGRTVRYIEADVEAWIETLERTET